WIGHVLGGNQLQDAILTFGQAAVFGTIHQPGKPALKLDMRDGASWLVEAEPVAMAAQAARAGEPRQPDFIVPSDDIMIRGLGERVERIRALKSAPKGASMSAGTTTIDLLVGYTDGFADKYTVVPGNDLIIKSRLNNFVAVTNESFVNSLVDAEVRLVHTMQVAYPDATEQDFALKELAGVKDGWIGAELAHPVLQPLHAAREEFDADLVSLVR